MTNVITDDDNKCMKKSNNNLARRAHIHEDSTHNEVLSIHRTKITHQSSHTNAKGEREGGKKQQQRAKNILLG